MLVDRLVRLLQNETVLRVHEHGLLSRNLEDRRVEIRNVAQVRSVAGRRGGRGVHVPALRRSRHDAIGRLQTRAAGVAEHALMTPGDSSRQRSILMAAAAHHVDRLHRRDSLRRRHGIGFRRLELRGDVLRHRGDRRIVKHQRAGQLHAEAARERVPKLDGAQRVEPSVHERLVRIDVATQNGRHGLHDRSLHRGSIDQLARRLLHGAAAAALRMELVGALGLEGVGVHEFAEELRAARAREAAEEGAPLERARRDLLRRGHGHALEDAQAVLER